MVLWGRPVDARVTLLSFCYYMWAASQKLSYSSERMLTPLQVGHVEHYSACVHGCMMVSVSLEELSKIHTPSEVFVSVHITTEISSILTISGTS